jgi:hypothetical protein
VPPFTMTLADIPNLPVSRLDPAARTARTTSRLLVGVDRARASAQDTHMLRSSRPSLHQVALAALMAGLASTGWAEQEKARTARQDCTDLPTGGPADVVRALYRDYPVEGRAKRLPFWNESREVLARYFDPRLTGLLLADQACQARGHFMCDITFNLLCACQAGHPSGYRFCRSRRGTEWVEVRFMLLGEERSLAVLTTKSAAGWRISDLVFPEGGSLVDLLDHPPR